MSEKLVKKLNKTKSRDFKAASGDEIVKEAETLLLGAHDKDLEVLKELHLDHQVRYDQKRTTDYRRTKKAEELYGKESYTGAQIKNLCSQYFLKMLPVGYYNGTIPSDLARTIREFCNSIGVPVKNHCFYILAPAEQFNNVEKVPRHADPILFYREPKTTTSRNEWAHESDIFTQVTNWGNDFSELRRLKYWFSTYDHRDYYSDNQLHLTPRTWTYIAIFFTLMSLWAGAGFNNFIFSMWLLVPAVIIMLKNSLSNPKVNKEWNTNHI